MKVKTADQLACDILEKKARKTLNDLLEITSREKECIIRFDGKSLRRLAEIKASGLNILKSLILSRLLNIKWFREDLSRLQAMNLVNMRLFRFLIKMGQGYKKIFKGTGLAPGVYNRGGLLENPSLSIRFNRVT